MSEHDLLPNWPSSCECRAPIGRIPYAESRVAVSAHGGAARLALAWMGLLHSGHFPTFTVPPHVLSSPRLANRVP